MDIRPSHKVILFTVFTLSGFIALVYEIVWSKYLSLTFGASIIAISIVTATFMGGLALGSYLLGRYADIGKNLLKIYAFLEIGIGTFAILFPPTLKIVETVHTLMEQTFPEHPAISAAVHFLFAAILLLPPTILMGGTFPVMCRLFARKQLCGEIGYLYALNTFGATLGALLSGFVLIPTFGLSTTVFLAASGNFIIAIISFLISRQATPSLEINVPSKEPFFSRDLKGKRLILTAAALAGAFSLACEILWTRTFLLFLGNTTYAFSLILSAYLVGISIGGVIFSRRIRPETNLRRLFIILTALTGISILVTAPYYDRLALAFQWLHEISNENWNILSALSYLLTLLVMLVPTVLSGSLFPAAVAILSPALNRTGEGVGIVVLFNTLGALVGSLAACFIFIPFLGLLDSYRTLGIFNIFVAIILLFHYRDKIPRHRIIFAPLAISLIISFAPVSWDQSLMNSGVYRYAADYSQQGGIRNVLSQERILDVIEGTDTTVAVHESLDGEHRFFTVNGKTDGSNYTDMDTQLLISHIPMILHPDPKSTLVIGLGTGISLKGLTHYKPETIDCVEISKEVLRAYDYFSEYNDYPLADPQINLSIEDGRNHLLTTTKRYDVIVSEPSNPWQAGNSNLFTDDFYKLASTKLNDNGLFCQWIGMYDITPENLRIVVKTFLNTFPNALAFSADADLILVGGTKPLSFDYLTMKKNFNIPGIRKTLAEIGINSPGELLASHYMSTEKSLSLFAGDSPLNTDDYSILEFSSRGHLGTKNFGMKQMENLSALLSSLDRVVLPLKNLGLTTEDVVKALHELGEGYEKGGKTSEAKYFTSKAMEIMRTPLPKG